jgi:hypothetical protein
MDAPRTEEKLDRLLRGIAGRLAKLSPRDAEQVSLIALALGAIYSLLEAIDRGYRDIEGARTTSDYWDYLRAAAEALTSPASNHRAGDVAEYFFNSGLIRIAILSECTDKYLGVRRDVAWPVRREVNLLKHKISGIESGRMVSLIDAIGFFTELVDLVAMACHA